MQVITATKARKEIYNLIKAKRRVEIQHKEGSVVLIPKEELENLEREALAFEMDQIRRTQKKYSDEEVQAMLAEVMNA